MYTIVWRMYKAGNGTLIAATLPKSTTLGLLVLVLSTHGVTVGSTAHVGPSRLTGRLLPHQPKPSTSAQSCMHAAVIQTIPLKSCHGHQHGAELAAMHGWLVCCMSPARGSCYHLQLSLGVLPVQPWQAVCKLGMVQVIRQQQLAVSALHQASMHSSTAVVGVTVCGVQQVDQALTQVVRHCVRQ